MMDEYAILLSILIMGNVLGVVLKLIGKYVFNEEEDFFNFVSILFHLSSTLVPAFLFVCIEVVGFLLIL